jgi:hypothetical protein
MFICNISSVYPIVAMRVISTSWAHVWRLRFCFFEPGYDNDLVWVWVAVYLPFIYCHPVSHYCSLLV